MVDCRVVAEGVEVFGTLTPWDEFSSITLGAHPPFEQDGRQIASASRVLAFEYHFGEFLEVADADPSWPGLIADLPRVRPLSVTDLDAVVENLPADSTLTIWTA